MVMRDKSTCYYCEKNEPITQKHNQLICKSCNEEEFRTIQNPSMPQTEKQKALRLKMLIQTFRDLFDEEVRN